MPPPPQAIANVISCSMRQGYKPDLSVAVLLIVGHCLIQVRELTGLIRGWQPNAVKDSAVLFHEFSLNEAARMRQVGDKHHAHRHRIAMAPPILFMALHRMAKGMTVIERFPHGKRSSLSNARTSC